jgi:F-type H+-transporting ATPase subunit b
LQTLIASIVILAQEAEENAPEDLYPHWEELLVGAIAFFILFFFIGRWALPRVNQMTEERRARIQGELERAERSRAEAEQLLAQYEERLRNARGEANRIIDEARKTGESVRKDLLAKAEDEARQVAGRAESEIRAERDRVFEELRRQVGELSVDLASRVIGQSLDKKRHGRLVDEYIAELAKTGDGGPPAPTPGDGNGARKKTTAKRAATKPASAERAPAKSSSRKRSSGKAATGKSTAAKSATRRRKS